MRVPDRVAEETSQGDLPAETLPEPSTSLLLFSAGGECWGLPIQAIQEIQPLGRVTRVPHAPPAVVGIQNLRGKVLTVCHLGTVVGGGAGDRDQASHVIVLAPDDVNRSVGIVVGEILRVVDAPLPPPEGAGNVCRGVITVDRQAVSVLDPHLLLSILLSL